MTIYKRLSERNEGMSGRYGLYTLGFCGEFNRMEDVSHGGLESNV